jgi:hypothetical protein
MKIISYSCDVCGREITTNLIDDVKGINVRIELDRGKYESVVFQHACSICQTSIAKTLREWVEQHKK